MANELCEDMRRLNLEVVNQGELEGFLSALTIQPSIFEEIKVKQLADELLQKIRDRVTSGAETEFKIHEDGSLRYQKRWCIQQKCEDIKRKIMEECHNTPYSIHPEEISCLPKTRSGNDTIWVIIDILTKPAMFIPIKETWKKKHLASVYVKNVVYLHGVPKDIVSDRDSRFLSKFWKKSAREPWNSIEDDYYLSSCNRWSN
ncbi:uncharacterized protein LOC110703750 [Chenopodium quinoa]|uniref:uncharacterized protein LOC110703750 n=1 Tax=Chenopodium quinoa TaxID=63459 RepID=UPI000B78A8E7|nr:uncharacterized protein LOC110703750 [Chenopodium quinoa]